MNRKAVRSTALAAALLLAVYALGMLIPGESLSADYLAAGQPPGLDHPFGTDALGRDLLLWTLKGLSVSMTIGIVASCASGVIALLVGAAAASGSQRADAAVNWIIDLVMSVPHTVFIILISFALGRGLAGLLTGVVLTHWCGLARIVRGEVLQLRSGAYVMASRRLGKTAGWILTRHFLPHLGPQLLTGMVLLFPHAVLHEASITFLGFGLPREAPAIGSILSESLRHLSAGMWWTAVFPGAILVLTVLLLGRLGENLRLLTGPAGAQEENHGA